MSNGPGAASAPETSTPATASSAESEAADESDFPIPLDDENLDGMVLDGAAAALAAPKDSATGGAAPVAALPIATPAVAPVAQPTVTATPPVVAAPAARATTVAAPQVDVSTAEGLLSALQANQEAMIDGWATELFALTQEESDALSVNPETVLPRLMAKTAMTIAQMIPHQIQQFVPSLIRAETQKAMTVARNENEFRTAWPGLGKANDALIVSIGKSYLAANKSATRADAVKAVGLIACQILGLDPAKAGAAAAQAPAGQRAQPAARPSAVLPFRPAGSAAAAPSIGGGSEAPATMDESSDPWGELTLPD